jgi:hypothetical protein
MTDEIRSPEVHLTRDEAKTPRAAAIAGILFSVLLTTSLVLIWITVPQNPVDAGDWLEKDWQNISLALNLLPYSGIAFLWFIGVVRSHLGKSEDRLFATVFLGSGLLFLAMLFTSAGIAGGIIFLYGVAPSQLINTGMYTFGRVISYHIMQVYTMRMAGVFMMSTSSLGLRTGVFPRWMAYLGIALALFLLFSMGLIQWAPVVFPLWVFLISCEILITSLRRRGGAEAAG